VTQQVISPVQWAPLMSILQAQSDASLTTAWPTDPALSRQCAETLGRADRAGVPIQYVFSAPYSPVARHFQGQKHDWLFVEATQDPNYHHANGFAVPAQNLQQLRRIAEAGIAFDAVWIAHELERSSYPALPVDEEQLLPPPPRPAVEQSARFGLWSDWLVKAATYLPVVVLGGATVLAVATSAAAVAAATVAVGMDPIVFGVRGRYRRPPHPGEPVAFFYLTHWQYNGEE
jgi:hypothetical protein